MTDIVKGMSAAHWNNWCNTDDAGEVTKADADAMRAALNWLAECTPLYE